MAQKAKIIFIPEVKQDFNPVKKNLREMILSYGSGRKVKR
jgi:hypothetical protein